MYIIQQHGKKGDDRPFWKMPGVSSNKAPKDSQGKFWQPAGLKTRKSRAGCGWIVQEKMTQKPSENHRKNEGLPSGKLT
jgi:hypothetical protein